MISQHVGKCLTEEQRARWVVLLIASAVEAGLPQDAEFRAAFAAYLEWGSHLAVENSQAQAHPPAGMPMPRWDRVCQAYPWARVSALAPAAEDTDTAIVVPGPDEEVGFAAHIKPLFRARDRQSMAFAFDLWSYTDVTAHAAAIADRVRAGSMPCDGAWPPERVAVFQRWVDTGTRP